MADENPERPASVTLRFKSTYAMDHFLGQLSDGWGENHVRIRPVEGKFYDAEAYTVDVFSDWGGENHEIEDEATDRQEQAMKQFMQKATADDGTQGTLGEGDTEAKK